MTQSPTHAENDVLLRDTIEHDIPAFFEHQLDPEDNYLVAFASKDPTDREAFTARWERILGNPAIIKKTIVYNGQTAGHIGQFERFGKPEVSYWLGREFRGRGIATAALKEFLPHVPVRPLYARVAVDTIASLRVLQKCGFTIIGYDSAFSETRGVDVQEALMELRG